MHTKKDCRKPAPNRAKEYFLITVAVLIMDIGIYVF